MKVLDNRPSEALIPCDPDAEKYLAISIDNLADVFGERLRLGLLSKAIKQKNFLENPAIPDDVVFTVLDSVAYHIKAVDDDPEYHDQYLDLFKSVPKYGQDEWYEKLDGINEEIKKFVTRDQEPNDLSAVARNRYKEGIKKFRHDKSTYLADLEKRRRDLQLHLGPSKGLDLTFLGGQFGGNVGGINSDASVPEGGMRVFAGHMVVKGDTGPINSGLSSGLGAPRYRYW